VLRRSGERRILRETVGSIPRNLFYAAGLLVALPVIGTSGYMILEGWSFLDALYMSVITLTTVGYREVQPLDRSGQIFTMLFTVSGVGAIFYALFSLFQFLLEGELGSFLGVRRMKGQIENLKNHYILCGFGRVGEEVSREFAEREIPFVVTEINPEAIERAERRGVLLLVGDATNDDILREAGIMRARCLLAASDSDSGNTFIVLTARALNPELFIVARAGNPESEPRMVRAGADRVFSPYITAGRQMALAAIQPMVVEFIDTLAMRQVGGTILAEIDVTRESGLAGQTIYDLLHKSRTIVVLGLQKATGQLQVGPPSSTVLEAGDKVIVMGEEDELERIRPVRGQTVG
jgi:voltage-gated potassium channel